MINTLNVLFCGFTIPSQNIPAFWSFMYWLSPLHYALEGLFFTQAHGDHKLITNFDGTKITAGEVWELVFTEWKFSDRGIVAGALIIYYAALRFVDRAVFIT